MLSKPQVIIVWCRIVVPDLPNNTGRSYFSIAPSQISMAVHNILPIGSLPVVRWRKLHVIPVEVSTVYNTHRQHVPVQASIVEHIRCSDAWTHLTAHPFNRTLHWSTFPTLTPLWGSLWWLVVVIIGISLHHTSSQLHTSPILQ